MPEANTERGVDVSNAPRKAVVLGGAGFLGKRLVTMLGGGDGSLEPRLEWPRFDQVHVLDRATFTEEADARTE